MTSNLTTYEIQALNSVLNVSDGHPRQTLTPAQQAIVARLPRLFEWSAQQPFEEIERAAQRTFLDSLGQRAAPVAEGRMLSCYSSSVIMDVVARALAAGLRTVGLVHPTFDNIPDLLHGRGLRLVPLDEDALCQGETSVPITELDAVFVTTPNNPTGRFLDPEALRSLALTCARAGRLLALDVCFRGFVPEFWYDVYALLDSTGVEYVAIEDTGKLWSLSELKLGFLGHSANCRLGLADLMSDVLLSVSPFVLALIAEFAADGAAGGYRRIHELVAANRATLGEVLGDTGVTLLDPASRISVCRVQLPAGLSGRTAWRDLERHGVHVLPCAPFHWADPSVGDRSVRVALGRDPVVVEKAAMIMRDYFRQRRG